MKLDLGAGLISPEGYKPMGRDFGSEVYPLPFEDASVEAIYSSHLLEHFPQNQVPDVVKEWARVLKPGGTMRIAVPDFGKIAEGYIAGQRQPTAAWILGGQTDENDYHKAMFDRDQLRAIMSAAGLVMLRPWKSEIKDCAEFEISLNIEGTKPFASELKVSGAMSVPRLGFLDNMFCCIEAMLPLNIHLRRQGGAFWGQALENCMEVILEQDNPDAILTIDYDSIFTPGNVAHLMQLMLVHPEIDALAPIQSNRHLPTALFTIRDENGAIIEELSKEHLEPDIQRAVTAHFGLTLIRADALRKMPKPWFHSIPDPKGGWHEGHTDDDTLFWQNFEKAGNSLFIANRVPIGHLEVMARWPGRDLQVIFQPMREFNETGKPPAGVWT